MARTTAAGSTGIETTESAGADETTSLQPPIQAGPMVDVRALISDQRLGLEAGRLGQVPAVEVEGLKAAGVVDDHPDAVAYARSLAD